MAKKGKMYFITGVCGVGKTAIIPFLRSDLSKEEYDIRDFDERGVPEDVDKKWRIKETEYWLNIGLANAERNIITIVCGFTKPNEIKNLITSKDIDSFICFLDASGEEIRSRLGNRYSDKRYVEELKKASGETPEESIEANIGYTSEFREICEQHKCKIIDAIDLSPEKVASKVAQWIKRDID